MYIEEVFDNRYKIISKLGQGGMGSIYLAVTNDRLEKKRAIKEVSYSKVAGADALHEAFILKDLEHDGIPRIIEIKDEPEKMRLYIVQEYIEGVTLQDIVDREGWIKDGIVLGWFIQLTDILDYIHSQNIIHRDIKPENIMLTREGKIKLIDFGISSTDEGLKKIAYTAKYASPEQRRQDDVGANSDIFSLGMTIYKLLTGDVVCLNKDASNYVQKSTLDPEKIKSGLVKIVEKCIEISPKKRYKNASELKKDLTNINKLSKEYKKKVWIRDIKIAFTICMIIAGGLFIKGGKARIDFENNTAFDDYIASVYEDIDKTEYDKAHKDLDSAKALFPNDINIKEVSALLSFREGSADTCIDYIQNLDEGELASSYLLNYLLGYSYLEKKDYSKANIYLEKAFSLDDSKEDVVRDYAVSCGKLGKVDEASRLMEYMKERNFSKSATLYVSGEIKQVKGDMDGAIKNFRASISLTDEDELKERAYISLAGLYKEDILDNKESSKLLIDTLEEANVMLESKNNLVIKEMLAEAYYIYADTMRKALEEQELYYKKSISCFDDLLALGYERAYIYKNIAILYQKLGDFVNAEKILNLMHEKYPENLDVYVQMIYLKVEEQASIEKQDRSYEEVASLYRSLRTEFTEIENELEFKQLEALMQELVDKNWLKSSDLD